MHVSVEELKTRMNHYANIDHNYRPRLIRYISHLLKFSAIGTNLPQALLEVEPQTKIRVHEILKEIPLTYLDRLIGYIPNASQYNRLRNALDGIRSSYGVSTNVSSSVHPQTADKRVLVQNYYQEDSKPSASKAIMKRDLSPSQEVSSAHKRRKTPAETKASLKEFSENPALWKQQSSNAKSNFRKQWVTFFGNVMPVHMQSVKNDRSAPEMKAFLKRCEKDQGFWNAQNGSQKAAARNSWEHYFPHKSLPDAMRLTVQVRPKKDIEAELLQMRDNPKEWKKLDAKKQSDIRSAWERRHKGVALPAHMKPKVKSTVSDVKAKLIQYERHPALWGRLDRFQKNNMRVAWQNTHFKERSLPKHMMVRTSKRPEQLQEYAQDEAKWKALKAPMRSKLRKDWDKYFPNDDMPAHMQSMMQSGATKVAAKSRASSFSR